MQGKRMNIKVILNRYQDNEKFLYLYNGAYCQQRRFFTSIAFYLQGVQRFEKLFYS
jgi:hypothetical protein